MNGCMNNNKIKGTFSNLSPSDECIESIFDMTIENKKSKGFDGYKRFVSAVMAFVIVVSGSGFGIKAIKQNDKPNNSMGIMVAYADEFAMVKSGTKQTIYNGLYFADADDEKECKKQYEKAQKDYNAILNEAEKLDEYEPKQFCGIGQYEIYDENYKLQAMLYTSSSGYFVVDKTNYENVKSMTVENISDDGYLKLEWDGLGELLLNQTEEDVDPDNPYSLFINHKLTISGDDLRESQKNFNNYGYQVNWVSAYQFFEAYGTNYTKGFTSSKIKDKIIFTFEYEDGTTESTSLNISFDKYGHMQVSYD